MADAHKNFAYSRVATAPAPAASGLSLIVTAGEGVNFPAVPFNASVWPQGVPPTPANAEIVRVTNIATDTLTIVRAQEGSVARTILVTDQIAATITAKTLTDIEAGVVVAAGGVTTTLPSIVFSNSNGVGFGVNGSTLTAAISNTQYTYINQQPAGVLTAGVPGQNSVWLAPMRFDNAVSASSGFIMLAFTGSVTSNVTHTVGATLRVALYKATGTNYTSFNTTFTTSFGFTFWNSGTASVSYSYNVTSGSSAGSNLMTASVYGNRGLTFNIGSILDSGRYAWGFCLSTSSAGGSSVMRSINIAFNAPILSSIGFIGSTLSGSLGFADAGIYSATSASMPVAFNITEVQPQSHLVPLLKLGAY